MSENPFNYRIVVLNETNDEKVALSRVEYDNLGAVVHVEHLITFHSIDEAYTFTNKIYEASLMGVVDQLDDDTYVY